MNTWYGSRRIKQAVSGVTESCYNTVQRHACSTRPEALHRSVRPVNKKQPSASRLHGIFTPDDTNTSLSAFHIPISSRSHNIVLQIKLEHFFFLNSGSACEMHNFPARRDTDLHDARPAIWAYCLLISVPTRLPTTIPNNSNLACTTMNPVCTWFEEVHLCEHSSRTD